MSDLITGACLCGGVRFEVTPPTKWCAHCHCTMCRRAHGAAIVTWFGVPLERFRLTPGENLVVWYASSDAGRRGFCGRCGSSLFFASERWPGEMHIVRTNVDGALDRDPSVHVYFDLHVGWLNFDDSLQKLGGPDGMSRL